MIRHPACQLTETPLPADPELPGWTVVQHKNNTTGRKWNTYHGPAGELAKSRVAALEMVR